jgi:hypothetical protein
MEKFCSHSQRSAFDAAMRESPHGNYNARESRFDPRADDRLESVETILDAADTECLRHIQ